MLSAVIIDDEYKGRLALKQKILDYCKDIMIIGEAADGKEGLELINEKKPDIVFLDIEMPLVNGFEMLQNLKERNFHLIFTTAYNHYAIKAIKYSAFDYLLKPIDEDEIAIALDKFKNQEAAITTEQVQNLHLFTNGKLQDTIALSTQEGLLFVKIDDIMYLEASSNYTMIVMHDKSKHLASKTLATFEEVLQDNTLFFRSHKSHVVNLKFIKQYIRGEGGELIMLDGKNVPLSRTKKQEFLDLFTRV